MLFAKQLSTLNLNKINAANRMAQTPNKLKHSHVNNNALTFAIFTHDGKIVLNNSNNKKNIPYSYQQKSFANKQLVSKNNP